MTYDVPAIAALARQCAPEIAAEAVVPLVMTESGGDPLRINVNRGPRVRARSASEGTAIVRRYMAAGYTVDVGLAQINSANFDRLGATIEQAFEPCTNLKFAAITLQEGFGRAARFYTGLDAISATYSLYNTGTLTRGFQNGYVDRVWTAATKLGLVDGAPASPVPASTGSSAPRPSTPADRDRWVVGQVSPSVVVVFR